MTMGERIRALRKKSNMSMEELGARLGVGKSAILKYEKGYVENLPRTKVEKMAALFRVSPEYIMAFDEKEKPESMTEDMARKYLTDKCGDRALELVNMFAQMTEKNKSKLLELCEDITKAQKYESAAAVFK